MQGTSAKRHGSRAGGAAVLLTASRWPGRAAGQKKKKLPRRTAGRSKRLPQAVFIPVSFLEGCRERILLKNNKGNTAQFTADALSVASLADFPATVTKMLANTQSIRCAFCLTCQKICRRDSTLRIVRCCLKNGRRLFFRPCGPSPARGHQDEPFYCGIF